MTRQIQKSTSIPRSIFEEVPGCSRQVGHQQVVNGIAAEDRDQSLQEIRHSLI